MTKKLTSQDIGQLIRQTRKGLGITQEALALAAGTGLRFISDLERGKPTCELEKTLHVLNMLGIRIQFFTPVADIEDRLQGKG